MINFLKLKGNSMLRLLQWLIFGHVHKWEVVKTCGLTDDGVLVGQRFFYKCTECGIHCKKDCR